MLRDARALSTAKSVDPFDVFSFQLQHEVLTNVVVIATQRVARVCVWHAARGDCRECARVSRQSSTRRCMFLFDDTKIPNYILFFFKKIYIWIILFFFLFGRRFFVLFCVHTRADSRPFVNLQSVSLIEYLSALPSDSFDRTPNVLELGSGTGMASIAFRMLFPNAGKNMNIFFVFRMSFFFEFYFQYK